MAAPPSICRQLPKQPFISNNNRRIGQTANLLKWLAITTACYFVKNSLWLKTALGVLQVRHTDMTINWKDHLRTLRVSAWWGKRIGTDYKANKAGIFTPTSRTNVHFLLYSSEEISPICKPRLFPVYSNRIMDKTREILRVTARSLFRRRALKFVANRQYASLK